MAYFVMAYIRRKRAVHFGNLSTLRKVHGIKRFDTSPLILVTKIIIISIIFLVATGSIEIRQQRPIMNQDYVFLLDSSSSMAAADFEPNRLSAAKQISKKWLSALPEETRIGFVSFSQDVGNAVPLTIDKGIIKNEIESVAINYSKSGTAIDYAINFGLEFFDKESQNKRIILLLTDGTEDVLPETVARVNALNARIFTFGIGENMTNESSGFLADEEIPEEFRNSFNAKEFNFTKLQELSAKTGGKAFQISDSAQLTNALNEATLETVYVKLNTSYYVSILIALLSILELVIYAKLGGI
ncbi:MAG: VWA domain-containing protein [Candidatus Woesearchaeota archaeon]